ncbi:hypothetical protein WMY93_031639 [Mugilogobius chulae]|uniref:protein disulfide-isomerase n=1 Tax=Mugilogobius chulae TaxID=88201 RepID=A0AAW0MD18_9GOBI
MAPLVCLLLLGLSALSKEFRVRTYPAIVLLKKDQKYNYMGPKTKDSILDFTHRVSGPSVRVLSSQKLLDHALSRHKVMFLFIGATSDLKWVSVTSFPAVLVFKTTLTSNSTILSEGNTNHESSLFVLTKVTDDCISSDFSARMQLYAELDDVTVPRLLLMNLTNDSYFEPAEGLDLDSEQDLVWFLDSVLGGAFQAQGGNSVPQRIRRFVYDAKTTLTPVFREAPFLGVMLVSIPLGVVLSLLFLCIKARPTFGDDDQAAEVSTATQRHKRKKAAECEEEVKGRLSETQPWLYTGCFERLRFCSGSAPVLPRGARHGSPRAPAPVPRPPARSAPAALPAVRRRGARSLDTLDLELLDLVEEVPQNFYELLSVEQDAPATDIKKAYRRLSLVLHPDKNKEPDAEVKFRQILDRSWADPVQILGRSWTDPGQILGRSWTDPGQILGRSWADPGQILDRSWADPGQILDRSWADPGQILDRSWTDPGQILDRSWDRSWADPGQILYRSWADPGTDPGQILGRSWADPVQILDRSCTDPGQILYRSCTDPGQILDRSWTDPGQIPGRSWTGKPGEISNVEMFDHSGPDLVGRWPHLAREPLFEQPRFRHTGTFMSQFSLSRIRI